MDRPKKQDAPAPVNKIHTKWRTIHLDEIKPDDTVAIQRLVQELAIYQAELETQNEELRTAQTQMEVERRKYVDLFTSAPIGYVTIRKEGRIVALNDAALSMITLARVQVVDHSFTQFLAVSDHSTFRDCLQQADATGGMLSCEAQIRRSDGTMLPVQLAVKAVAAEYRDDGSHFRIAMTDDTYRRAAQQHDRDLTSHFNRLSSDLMETTRELEIAGSVIARELEEQLKMISTYFEGAGTEGAEPRQNVSPEAGRSVKAAVRRVGRLISDLQILTRLGQSPIAMVDCDLSKIVHGIADGLRKTEPDRHIDFVVKDHLMVRCDRRLIELVLSNLLENAWKATRTVKEARIVVDTLARQGSQTYFVQDNGVGFDMKDANKLFLPFHRLHPEADETATGVGLALVARAVRRHGGRVWAEAEPNRGATFYFTLGE